MRSPIRDLAHNLMWTTDGTCWATWRLKPESYGHRPVKEKQEVASWHRYLFRALDGQALILGITVPMDSAGVVDRMLQDNDGNRVTTPAMIEEAHATLDLLDADPYDVPDDPVEIRARRDPAHPQFDTGLRGVGLGQRVHYMAVPLSNQGSQFWSRPLDAAVARLKEALALPRAHPSQDQVRARLRQAERVAANIPAKFAPTPVGVAEQVWLARHMQSRGMLDMPPETAEEISDLVTTNGVVLPEPVLDPGAASDDRDRVINPLRRRVLKVVSEKAPDQPASYQGLLVMTGTPSAGLTFPGSELFARLDEYAQHADWAIRLQVNPRDKTMRANRAAVRSINEQFHQRADETGEVQGLHELEQASKEIREYQAQYSDDRLEVEVEHTLVIAVGATDYDSAQQQVDDLKATLGQSDFQFEQPVGSAADLWWSMHPGVATSSVVRAYSQYTTSTKFARLVPLISTRVGGSTGPIVALNISAQLRDVIHLDPAGYAELDINGSICATGENGGGKSTMAKTMCAHIVSRGGQLLAVDKDPDGEWAVFARALDQDTMIVDPLKPAWSMDPLRIMGDSVRQASIAAQAFFFTLLNLQSQGHAYNALQHALQETYLRTHKISSSMQLMDHLHSDQCDLAGAKDVAEALEIQAGGIYGQLIFDEDLPPVNPSGNIVWLTSELRLPTKADMDAGHLYSDMDPRKKFGRAYYRLMMSSARQFAFADSNRATVFVNDEAYDMYSNEENVADGEHFMRMGRRYSAMLLVMSHNPDDFGSDRLRELFKTRLAFRHTDKDAAQAAIRFLGIAENDPEFEAMVTTLRTDMSPVDLNAGGVPPHRRGECFIKDAGGTVGDAKILLPARASLRRAVLTTPSQKSKQEAS